MNEADQANGGDFSFNFKKAIKFAWVNRPVYTSVLL